MFSKSARFCTLALTLVMLTASFQTLSAQSSTPDPDPNPKGGQVVGGTDPVPVGQAMSGGTTDSDDVVGGTDPVPVGQVNGDDPDTTNAMIIFLLMSGLA